MWILKRDGTCGVQECEETLSPSSWWQLPLSPAERPCALHNPAEVVVWCSVECAPPPPPHTHLPHKEGHVHCAAQLLLAAGGKVTKLADLREGSREGLRVWGRRARRAGGVEENTILALIEGDTAS